MNNSNICDCGRIADLEAGINAGHCDGACGFERPIRKYLPKCDIVNSATSIPEIMSQTTANQPIFQSALAAASCLPGTVKVMDNFKGAAGIAHKADLKGLQVSQIRDTYRGAVVVSAAKYASLALATVVAAGGFKVLNLEGFNPDSAWPAVMADLRAPNGQVIELQIMLDTWVDVKDTLLHPIYEAVREGHAPAGTAQYVAQITDALMVTHTAHTGEDAQSIKRFGDAI